MSKKDAVESVIDKLNKKYGKQVVSRGFALKKNWFPTGIVNVDWALGGGFIQGGFVELYGPPSSGKSTIALKAIGLAQKEEKVCAYIDAEDAYDPDWAIKNGVDNDSLLLMDKEKINEIAKDKGDKGINAEFVLQLMIDLIDTKGVDILVLDSIACLTPKDELNVKGMDEEAKMAGVAKLMTRALRVMNSKNQRSSTVIFINQLRDNLGYGGGSTTPGGRAVKFFSFQRLNVKRGKNVVKKSEVIGYNARVILEKSKVSVPYKSVEFVMYNDSSIDRFEVYWNLAKVLDNFGEGLTLTGRTYTYNGEVVAKNQDDFRAWLLVNQEVFEKLEKSLIETAKCDKPIVIDVVDKNVEEIAKEVLKDE
jgi:recombination protein RecA